MKNSFIFLILFIMARLSAPGEETNLLSAMSPKLRKLMVAHPAAFTALVKASSMPSRTNYFTITYFYSEDDRRPRATHYYPNTVGLPDVIIRVRENGQVLK